MTTVESIRPAILALHDRIRDAVVAACEQQTADQLAAVAAEDASDTIYAIDRVSESTLVEEVRIWAAENVPVILIAEGLQDGGLVFPDGVSEDEVAFRIIVDPIDGTRGLMYQKRSAWVLTGVAPNKGPGTGLRDIELSVMTEIPLVKQHLSDQGWAIRGEGAHWTRYNRLAGGPQTVDRQSSTVNLRPSTADSIAHGFSTVTRLFPNARDVLGAIDDELVRRVLGPQPAGKALCFEDQYASSGGQMYELIAGHDRFIADIRPLIHKIQMERGEAPCICAHPYDVCALLIAEEAGVEITGVDGSPLDAPLDTTSDVAWIGYANRDLRKKLEPVFQDILRKFGLTGHQTPDTGHQTPDTGIMVSASAPGRLDVMGGIADYSGSLVLQMPIKEETRCEIKRRQDRIVQIRSANRAEAVEVDLDQLAPGGELASYEAANAYFRERPDRHWASYIVGVLLVLSREERIFPTSGLTISIVSDVPEGKGVSSSAALEVATMRACLKISERELPQERIAELCQMAENRVAGAPCGIMDQMTASCGRRGMLMKLLCRPAELQGFVPLPDGVSVWGIDSGVRHAVTGSDYTSVRAGAFMGLRIIETAARSDATRFGGYLANIGPEVLREKYARKLPDEMLGRDFLREFEGISDPVVIIDPDKIYRVRASASHPIREHDRVTRFAKLMQHEPTTKNLAMLGELMYLSHAGYSSCGLGSPGTDRIVQMVREVGYKEGLFGARISGGGSGGAVAVLGRTDAAHKILDIANRYKHETGLGAQIF